MDQGDNELEFVPDENNKSGQPGVINRQMLVKLAIEQGAKGVEASKLLIQDGINLSEIQEIRIEFLNILKIDNLWIMANCLTRLKLSNNAIEKIENLDSLVNLTELDLSFNHIRVIENLENFVNLEIILLYSNEISEIGGIDRSTGLTILSIGANKIDDGDHVMYLRQFKKLRTLNVAGNSCTKKDGYFDYLVGFLPQIVYLNYKMLSESERKIAQEKHQRAIANLEEKEAIERAEMEEKQASEEKQALLSLSYVEYLNGDEFFRQMYQHDKVGGELSLISEESRAAHEEYEKKFTELCRQLYEFGLIQQDRRSEEMRLFEKTVDEGREAVHAEAREMMDEIIARKVDIFEQVGGLMIDRPRNDDPAMKQNDDASDIDDDIAEKVEQAQRLSDEFNDLLSKTWNKLMYREVILHEQIEDTNETHKLNMGDLTTAFTETARTIFSQMRDAEADYNDNIEGIATMYANDFTDQLKMPSRHMEICGDKDILSNNLAASHDLHLQTIDAREDHMLSRIKSWYDDYTERLAREESERNRSQVLEISHFLEHQRQEFESLQSQLRSRIGDSIDADVIAAMEAD